MVSYIAGINFCDIICLAYRLYVMYISDYICGLI